MAWDLVSRVWRCSCGALLDYQYHTIWRCRGCNTTHDLRPMQPLDIRVSFDASAFEKVMRSLIK